jgi:hypothetical protein
VDSRATNEQPDPAGPAEPEWDRDRPGVARLRARRHGRVSTRSETSTARRSGRTAASCASRRSRRNHASGGRRGPSVRPPDADGTTEERTSGLSHVLSQFACLRCSRSPVPLHRTRSRCRRGTQLSSGRKSPRIRWLERRACPRSKASSTSRTCRRPSMRRWSRSSAATSRSCRRRSRRRSGRRSMQPIVEAWYRTLLYYFPAQAATLPSAYNDALALSQTDGATSAVRRNRGGSAMGRNPLPRLNPGRRQARTQSRPIGPPPRLPRTRHVSKR